MIINYHHFINEDWKSDLFLKTKEFIRDSITEDEIEDYFLELIDVGFIFTIKMEIMHFSGHQYHSISKKIDSLHKCYPVYRINLNKSSKNIVKTNVLYDVEQTQEELKTYDRYIDLYKIAFNRIISLHSNLEIISNEVKFSNAFIGFNCLLKIDREIPKNFVELRDVKNRDFYLMIMRALSNNKIFSVVSSKSIFKKNIIVKSISDVSNDNYYINILQRIVKNYGIVNKIDKDTYEITMLEN